jgi:hypothetical protein
MKTSFFASTSIADCLLTPLVRIASLRGTFNLAVQLRTISAKAFRVPLASTRAALAAALSDMPFTGVATSKNSEVLRGQVC